MVVKMVVRPIAKLSDDSITLLWLAGAISGVGRDSCRSSARSSWPALNNRLSSRR
jgi:hypothetical protein